MRNCAQHCGDIRTEHCTQNLYFNTQQEHYQRINAHMSKWLRCIASKKNYANGNNNTKANKRNPSSTFCAFSHAPSIFDTSHSFTDTSHTFIHMSHTFIHTSHTFIHTSHFYPHSYHFHKCIIYYLLHTNHFIHVLHFH